MRMEGEGKEGVVDGEGRREGRERGWRSMRWEGRGGN
jgi:hypothetical protein